MLSFITPPVALAAVAASTIAKSDAMKTGATSMRLGLVNFILPFLFVLNPELILGGDLADIVHILGTTVVAVWLASSFFEHWLYGVGELNGVNRVVIGVAAVCFLFPGIITDIAGASIVICVVAVHKSKIKALAQ